MPSSNRAERSPQDPGDLQHGYCYVKDGEDGANPLLTADCPDTQQQIIRFMGNDVPRPRALAFIACLGDAVPADRRRDVSVESWRLVRDGNRKKRFWSSRTSRTSRSA